MWGGSWSSSPQASGCHVGLGVGQSAGKQKGPAALAPCLLGDSGFFCLAV